MNSVWGARVEERINNLVSLICTAFGPIHDSLTVLGEMCCGGKKNHFQICTISGVFSVENVGLLLHFICTNVLSAYVSSYEPVMDQLRVGPMKSHLDLSSLLFLNLPGISSPSFLSVSIVPATLIILIIILVTWLDSLFHFSLPSTRLPEESF